MKHIFFLMLVLIGSAAAKGQEIAGIKKLLNTSYGSWTLSDSVRTFDQDNLYDYIDGAADNYLANNFEALLVSTYYSGEKYITVEVYQHQTPDFAFGIYAQERPLKTEFLITGTQGYKEKGILNFLTGKYYVKLATHDESLEAAEVMTKIASDLAAKIDPNPAMPAILSSFPVKGKIQNSETLINMNFLGYEFLRKAWVATYGNEGKTFRLYIIETPSAEDAKKMVTQYMEKTKCTFPGTEGRFLVKDPYNGYVVMEWKGKYLWGILPDKNENVNDEYLELIKGNLFPR